MVNEKKIKLSTGKETTIHCPTLRQRTKLRDYGLLYHTKGTGFSEGLLDAALYGLRMTEQQLEDAGYTDDEIAEIGGHVYELMSVDEATKKK